MFRSVAALSIAAVFWRAGALTAQMAPGACRENNPSPPKASMTSGPDLIIADLQNTRYYGHQGEIHAFSVGHQVCNIGDERVGWFANINQHPVFARDLYRLKNDRFEQIGMSWLAHGFYAVSWDFCGPCNDPTDGTQLGVGCSTPISASQNGIQSNSSRRSDVNPHTGYFPYPWTAPDPPPVIGRRLQVHVDDLDPAPNEGALYFVQGYCIAPDDASVGNGDNNAAYRPVDLSVDSEGEYELTPLDQTRREQPAIRAWRGVDPSVVETDVRVPGEGLFLVAAKSASLGNGIWRYAYAVQNFNSDRAAASFSVPLPEGTLVTNIGFHDVDYHSGEIYDLTDWPATVDAGAITWATEPYDLNPNANALRFDTLYNFYFDTNVQPDTTTVIINLFKPGFPSAVSASTIGPKLGLIDCNGNGIADECDIDCDAPDCIPPCGGSTDCNENGVPDECEPDCNENGIADECDILNCDGSLWCNDCNENTVPDGCEPDCDGNGIPDDCVLPPDTDGDGVNDCEDLCPCTLVKCQCPPLGQCCWQSGLFCLPDIPPATCIEMGGVPECTPAECQDGCVIDFTDCNANGIEDHGDLYCLGEECLPPCGQSLDCNVNDIPDECEVPPIDPAGQDCNHNTVPDECEMDADGDGLIDACDGCPDDPYKTEPGQCGCGHAETGDDDADGVLDCVDQCPGADDAVFAPACQNAIPTVSEWGIVVIMLMVLVVAKICFRRPCPGSSTRVHPNV